MGRSGVPRARWTSEGERELNDSCSDTIRQGRAPSMNSASPTRANKHQALTDPLLAERLAVVRASADHHARRLVKWVRDAGEDVDDLRQALILAAWSRIAQFDPARASWSTFVNLVIRHAAWDLAAEAFRRQSRTA